MTALTKYTKLESTGLWRENAQGQRREVIANLGDSSLVLSDPKQEVALAHWSLPAVIRLNPGELPAIYAPGLDAEETLETSDRDMIGALEQVHAALRAAGPHPGRLRNGLLGSAAAAILAVGAFWMPDALVNHTASVMPIATRMEIGRMALIDMIRLTGQPCQGRRGQDALNRLRDRLLGPESLFRVLVVREGIARATHIPGRQIVLSEALLAEQDGPELAAGFILYESLIARQRDPVVPLLDYAGLHATFQLLTTGALSAKAVAGYAETRLSIPNPEVDEAQLLARFEASGVPSTPFAGAMLPGSPLATVLVEADPFSNVIPPRLMPDEDWVSLQDICSS
jgi:hypothetical protein